MSSREMKLSGWWTFAAILLAISGTLNVIWGISAIGNSHFFTQHAHYVAGSLRTWGWIAVILGALELVAAGSLFGGGEFGRWFGIFAAAFTSIAALLSIIEELQTVSSKRPSTDVPRFARRPRSLDF